MEMRSGGISLHRHRQILRYARPMGCLSMPPCSHKPHLCTQEAVNFVYHIYIYLASILNFERRSVAELSNTTSVLQSSDGTNTCHASHTMALSIFGLLVGILIVYIVARRLRRAKLPPGPPGLPLLGNLRQAPKGTPWLTFTK